MPKNKGTLSFCGPCGLQWLSNLFGWLSEHTVTYLVESIGTKCVAYLATWFILCRKGREKPSSR